MLEGKELERKIGNSGSVSIDVTPDLKIKIAASVEIDILAEVKKLAVKTGTPLDDQAIAWLEALLELPINKEEENQ